MILEPPPIHAPWTLDPRTGKLNDPSWLKWFDQLVTATQLSDEFAGIQAFQTTEGSGMLASTRSDYIVTQDDLAALTEVNEPTGLKTTRVENGFSAADLEPTGVRSSRNDDDAMIFTMMSF